MPFVWALLAFGVVFNGPVMCSLRLPAPANGRFITEVENAQGDRSYDDNASHELDTQSSFENTYATSAWGGLDQGGGSGGGSTMRSTKWTGRVITAVLKLFKIKSMLDAPCGAFTWQPHYLSKYSRDVHEFRYIGVDIVRPVIANISAQHARTQAWRFEVLDFTKDMLPHVDLIFSRDALQHIPWEMAIDALENFAMSGCKWLLVGSYMEAAPNRQIPIAGYYDIDLQRQPFGMDDADLIFAENAHVTNPQKYLLLFSGEKLRSIDFIAMRHRAQEMQVAKQAHKK